MSYKLHLVKQQPRSRASRASTVAPYHRGIVDRVDGLYPHLLVANTAAACAEFLQRVLAAMPTGEQWGHLSKAGGEAGHTLPNNVRVSHDVICHKPTGRQVDIIAAGAADPNPHTGKIPPAGTTWIEIDPSVYRPHNVWQNPFAHIYPSGANPGTGSGNATEIYFGFFPLMAALRSWREEAITNFRWINEQFPENDGFRVFLNVEGRSHARPGMPDPWRDATVDPNWPDWSDRLRQMLHLVGGAGKKVYATVYGGRNYNPTEDSRRRFHARIVTDISKDNLWGAVRGFHMMNEFRVNHWEAAEVRAAGRDMRSKLPPGMPMSLSSPHLCHSFVAHGNGYREPTHEEMTESFEELYGGADHAGATEIAYHLMRDRSSRWSDPMAFNDIMPDLEKINHEPEGPGASAGGSTADAALLQSDLARTKKARNVMYVPHMAWCVFNGHLPTEYAESDDVRMVSDTRNILPIIAGWRAADGGGSVIPIPPTGDVDMAQLPDRGRVMAFINWLHEYYGSAEGLKRPTGLINGTQLDAEGIATWAYDVYLRQVLSGKTDDDAKKEVRRQIEESGEWKQKHPTKGV